MKAACCLSSRLSNCKVAYQKRLNQHYFKKNKEEQVNLHKERADWYKEKLEAAQSLSATRAL